MDSSGTDGDASGTIVTVLGPVSSAAVGPTLMHEHIFVDLSALAPEPTDPEARRRYLQPLTLENRADIRWSREGLLSKANIDMSNMDEAVSELNLFWDAGGRTVVELSSIGLRGDVAMLRVVALRTGLNIVCGAGYFVDRLQPPEVEHHTSEDLAGMIVDEFANGIGGTSIRPGIMGEIGTSSPITPNEIKSLIACAIASRITGMSISVHLDPWATEGLRVLDILADAGTYLPRVIIGHLNPSLPDIGYHLAIAARGAVLGYDLCGYELPSSPGRFPPHDWQTADAIAKVVEAGFGDQIVLSRDTSLKTDYHAYGGWGYDHILRRMVPLLREKAIPAWATEAMIVGTPRRLLTLELRR